MTGIPRVVVVAAFAVLASACSRPDPSPAGMSPLPVFRSTQLVPEWVSQSALAREEARMLPPVRLRDQRGETWTPAMLRDKVVIANFFFTGCTTLCPRLHSAMARVDAALTASDEVVLLSHSVTPESDTPEVLAAYARANRIDGRRWRLLTGERDALARLQAALYLVPETRVVSDRQITHTETIVLLDRLQRVRGIYNATLAVDVEHLIGDARLLLDAPAT